MTQRTKYLTGIIATLLFFSALSPSIAQAQDFALFPPEVSMDNLSPGEEAEFYLNIHNKDAVSHIFTLSAYNAEESQRRTGRAEFPDNDWISFSPQRLEVPANSNAKVKVIVTIPADYKWAAKNWEVWLGVSPESSEFLTVKLYVRLLVSTDNEVEKGRFDIWLIIGIVAAVTFIGYIVHRFRYRRLIR